VPPEFVGGFQVIEFGGRFRGLYLTRIYGF
jgi:hypothetical protein